MIVRRILETTLVNAMGYEYKIYGRFDAVKIINDGWKIVNSEFKHYQMDEKTFVENAKCVSNKNSKEA